MPRRVTKHCNLEQRIAQTGMSRREFCETSGVSLCYLSQIITMQRKPGADVNERIRETLQDWSDDLYESNQDWERQKIDDNIKYLQYWKRVLAMHKANYGDEKGGDGDKKCV